MEQTETMVKTEQMVKMEQMVKTGKMALMSVQLPEQLAMLAETETTVITEQMREDRADGDDGER